VICIGTVIVEPHGSVTVLRCTLSAVVKSPTEKYLLHIYVLCSFLEESTVQDIQSFPAHTRALEK
jgi:hypothetical protein